MTFKNIEFDSSILKTDSKEIHIFKLKVVSENLSEFNQRNTEDKDIKYKYHKRVDGYFGEESYIFDRINETNGYPHYSDSYFTPNWLVYISQNPDKFDEWHKHYCNRVFNSFKRFLNLYTSKEIDLFLKLFKDYYPKGGFLSNKQIQTFKKEINLKCELAENSKQILS